MGNLLGGAPTNGAQSPPGQSQNFGFLDRLAGNDAVDPVQLKLAADLGIDPSKLQSGNRRKALLAVASGLASGEPLAAGLAKGIGAAQSVSMDSLNAAAKNSLTEQELKKKKYGLDALDQLSSTFNDPNATPEQKQYAILKASSLSGDYGASSAIIQAERPKGVSGPKTAEEIMIAQATGPDGKFDYDKYINLVKQHAQANHVGSGNGLADTLSALSGAGLLTGSKSPYAVNQSKVLSETDKAVRDKINTEADTYNTMAENFSAMSAIRDNGTPEASDAGLAARTFLNAALPKADPKGLPGRVREFITESKDIPGQRTMQDFQVQNQVFYQNLLKGASSDRDMQLVANAGSKISDPARAMQVSARVSQLLRDRHVALQQVTDPARFDPESMGSMGRYKSEFIKDHPILPQLQQEFPDVFGAGPSSGGAPTGNPPSDVHYIYNPDTKRLEPTR